VELRRQMHPQGWSARLSYRLFRFVLCVDMEYCHLLLRRAMEYDDDEDDLIPLDY